MITTPETFTTMLLNAAQAYTKAWHSVTKDAAEIELDSLLNVEGDDAITSITLNTDGTHVVITQESGIVTIVPVKEQ